MKIPKESIIRKEVGRFQKMSPLKRAFRLKKMIEDLRGERLDSKNENIRRIVGRVK
jgi:hypothetical protein